MKDHHQQLYSSQKKHEKALRMLLHFHPGVQIRDQNTFSRKTFMMCCTGHTRLILYAAYQCMGLQSVIFLVRKLMQQDLCVSCWAIWSQRVSMQFSRVGMPLFRKMKDGTIFQWKAEKDAPLCTLREAFEEGEHSLGLNMELKFDDHIVYTERQLKHVLHAILQVYFLTEGGYEMYADVRKNSLEEAIRCAWQVVCKPLLQKQVLSWEIQKV